MSLSYEDVAEILMARVTNWHPSPPGDVSGPPTKASPITKYIGHVRNETSTRAHSRASTVRHVDVRWLTISP